MTRFRTALALAALAAAVVAAGCSSDDGDDDGGAGDETTTTTAAVTTTTTEVTTTTGDEGAADALPDDEVAVVGSTLGDVLTLGGWPIYAFDDDTPDTSACTDDCAAAWPPVPADVVVPDDLGLATGSVARDDGADQLTVDGAPAYTFATDEPLPADGSGEPVGQGVGDVWWVLAADGTPRRDGAPG